MKTTIRKTFKYRLYQDDKRDKHFHDQINIAGIIWNHALALQKRYYRLTRKYISIGRMKSHIAKLRMKTSKYRYWKKVGSQATQAVIERLDDGYVQFFKGKRKRPPKFKKVKNYKSFVLKQKAGWGLFDDTNKRGSEKHPKFTGHVRIQKHVYKL